MKRLLEVVNKAIVSSQSGFTLIESAAKRYEVIEKLINMSKAESDLEAKASMLGLKQDILNTKSAYQNLQSEFIKITNEIREEQNRREDFNRYEFWITPMGAVVFRLKETHSNGEPEHYICANCMSKGKKSYLHGQEYSKECKSCDENFEFLNPNDGESAYI